uniref:Putative secreted protein n=1 Tax=Amblyomma triste TaxID=251400 RepID=A0A023G343_AMBTT
MIFRMSLLKHSQQSVISIVTLALAMTVSCTRAQDCQQSPESCDSEEILSNYLWLNDVATSYPENPTNCERYERTSLSDDGKTAHYNFVYTERGGDTTPISDTCTYEAVSKTVIDIGCTDFAPTVYHLTLDYVNGNNCFVGHANVDDSNPTQYYFLLTNPDSNEEEYESCYNKLNDYTGGNYISLRDEEKMQKMYPPKKD